MVLTLKDHLTYLDIYWNHAPMTRDKHLHQIWEQTRENMMLHYGSWESSLHQFANSWKDFKNGPNP
jgi:hypothetical protein